MKPSANLEKLFLRNYRFISRYICGNHRIDSRLVSKFINEFPPKAADVKLYRAEVQSLSGKKNKKTFDVCVRREIFGSEGMCFDAKTPKLCPTTAYRNS